MYMESTLLGVSICHSYFCRYDDIYHLHVTYQDGETKKVRSQSVSKSVSNFFDENGQFCMDKFEPEVSKLHNGLAADKKEK